MMAAAARECGTSAPESSSLNCGCWASRRALAAAAARARAAAARRARAVEAADALRTAGFFLAAVVVVVFLAAVWAARGPGSPTRVTAARRHVSRIVLKSRVWV